MATTITIPEISANSDIPEYMRSDKQNKHDFTVFDTADSAFGHETLYSKERVMLPWQ